MHKVEFYSSLNEIKELYDQGYVVLKILHEEMKKRKDWEMSYWSFLKYAKLELPLKKSTKTKTKKETQKKKKLTMNHPSPKPISKQVKNGILTLWIYLKNGYCKSRESFFYLWYNHIYLIHYMEDAMVQKMELDIETIFEDIHSIEMDDNTKELLQNGVPAYIKEPGMANGFMIKLYPNGTKETVHIDETFHETVVNL